MLKLLSWVKPCLIYTVSSWHQSCGCCLTTKIPIFCPLLMVLLFSLVLILVACISNLFLATLCFSLAYWTSVFQTGWAIGVDHSCVLLLNSDETSFLQTTHPPCPVLCWKDWAGRSFAGCLAQCFCAAKQKVRVWVYSSSRWWTFFCKSCKIFYFSTEDKSQSTIINGLLNLGFRKYQEILIFMIEKLILNYKVCSCILLGNVRKIHV